MTEELIPVQAQFQEQGLDGMKGMRGMRRTREMGETRRDSTRMRGLYTFCLAKPGSITYTIPSMVRDVSAMLVDTTIFRPAGPPGRVGGGAGSKISCCCFGGRVEYSGNTLIGPTCTEVGTVRNPGKDILHCTMELQLKGPTTAE